MKNISISIILLIGLASGFFISNVKHYLRPDHIQIRIIDRMNCEVVSYSIKLHEKTVSISGEQINREETAMHAETDTMVRLLADKNDQNEIEYYIHADYSDCPEIISRKRTVKPSNILYETIKDGKINHKLRAG